MEIEEVKRILHEKYQGMNITVGNVIDILVETAFLMRQVEPQNEIKEIAVHNELPPPAGEVFDHPKYCDSSQIESEEGDCCEFIIYGTNADLALCERFPENLKFNEKEQRHEKCWQCAADYSRRKE